MCGFIAQLVEHRTGITEVTGSNPAEARIFFRLLLSNCLNWKIYCDFIFQPEIIGRFLGAGPLNPRTNKDPPIPIKFFQSFEKTICPKGLKLSVAIPSFSVEILICQLCVQHF